MYFFGVYEIVKREKTKKAISYKMIFLDSYQDIGISRLALRTNLLKMTRY